MSHPDKRVRNSVERRFERLERRDYLSTGALPSGQTAACSGFGTQDVMTICQMQSVDYQNACSLRLLQAAAAGLATGNNGTTTQNLQPMAVDAALVR